MKAVRVQVAADSDRHQNEEGSNDRGYGRNGHVYGQVQESGSFLANFDMLKAKDTHKKGKIHTEYKRNEFKMS
jgi:hypothetical protein